MIFLGVFSNYLFCVACLILFTRANFILFFCRAKFFLQEVLDAYNTRYTKAYRMLGDQLSLVSVVKSHLPSAFQKFSRQKAFAGEVNGVIVQFLPCAVYNWTPPEGAGQFHGMPLDVQVPDHLNHKKLLFLFSYLVPQS